MGTHHSVAAIPAASLMVSHVVKICEIETSVKKEGSRPMGERFCSNVCDASAAMVPDKGKQEFVAGEE